MKRILVFLLICSSLGITGCERMPSAEQQVGMEENHANLTPEKKDFLSAISMDEERVQEGKLYEWQKEVLRQYDYAMAYLGRKYPSHSFYFTGCNPAGKNESFSTFWFTADGGTDSYELYLYTEADGDYNCEDNYYGELIEDSYNDALLSLLEERVPECIGVACDFNTVQGEAFGEQLTGQEILDGDYGISNTTCIYAVQPDAAKAQTLAKKLGSVINEQGIYGSYYIEILDSEPDDTYSGDELRAYVQAKDSQDIVLEWQLTYFN